MVDRRKQNGQREGDEEEEICQRVGVREWESVSESERVGVREWE